MSNALNRFNTFKSNLLIAALMSLLFITQTAHADFRKALDAYQARDGATMLKEVRDAVDRKNDDGLILYLSILKQYPKTWQSTLDSSQQAELFNCLEAATAQSSLQSQYRLAVISRLNDYPKPNSPEANQEELALIQRLELVASKGYAPAAYYLYGHRSPQSKEDQANALKWLIKAAELGSTEAAFNLGMKYLNVTDDYYGCRSYEPSLCLPKDETKGWYWMQQVATKASERNIRLGDFAYEMGNLYRQGVAGNKPDLEQAYLWYMLGANSAWYHAPTIKIKEQLERMQKDGQLKHIAPQLDIAWNDAKKREQLLHPKQLLKTPDLLKSKKDKNNKTKPVFSFFSFGFYGVGQVIDMYVDGTIRLSNGDLLDPSENNENIIKIDSTKIQSFVTKIKKLGIDTWPLRGDYDECFADCFNLTRYVITLNDGSNSRTVLMSNEGFSYTQEADKNYVLRIHRVAEVIGLLNAFMPKNFPSDKFRCSLTAKGAEYCQKFDLEIFNLLKQGYAK